jgi:hypothetical protein
MRANGTHAFGPQSARSTCSSSAGDGALRSGAIAIRSAAAAAVAAQASAVATATSAGRRFTGGASSAHPRAEARGPNAVGEQHLHLAPVAAHAQRAAAAEGEHLARPRVPGGGVDERDVHARRGDVRGLRPQLHAHEGRAAAHERDRAGLVLDGLRDRGALDPDVERGRGGRRVADERRADRQGFATWAAAVATSATGAASSLAVSAISMRRFWLRAWTESFGASGRYSEKPIAPRMAGETPFDWR